MSDPKPEFAPDGWTSPRRCQCPLVECDDLAVWKIEVYRDADQVVDQVYCSSHLPDSFMGRPS